MNNELYLFLHIFLVMGFLLGALRWGKEAVQSLIALFAVLANLFVVKQMRLFGFSVTCSDVYAVGAILGLNLLQEYWGAAEARKAVKVSFLTLLFFILSSQIHLLYAPTPEDWTNSAFFTLFSQTPRIAAASVLVYFLVQQMDVLLFGRLKIFFQGARLPLRVGISLLVSQLLDTILFSFLGLYGLVSSLFDIILVSFAVKCFVILLSSPFTAFSKRFLRNVSL